MTKMQKPIVDRFWSKVVKGDGCWRWTGAKTNGYGYLTLGGRNSGLIRAHRFSYEFHFGPIPHGLVVRHKCDNPECTNPDHLEVGTHQDNMKDIVLRRRHARHGQTHCLNGHEFSEKNTFINARGHRYCKVCKNENQKKKLREDRGENFGKKVWTPRTHCPHGHALDESNTYIRPDGYKECKICRVERMARFKAAKNAL